MNTINQKTEWGYYVVQIDESALTLALKAEFGFEKPPGLVQIPCKLDKPFALKNISGSGCIAGWGAGTNASIVADIIAKEGWTHLASVKSQVLDRGSDTIGVNTRLREPVAISGLTVQFFVDEPGAQTFSWSLILS